ncbi:MAG: hypothetical protein WBK28_01820 [Minisyncoccia bacterium]
MSELLPQPEDSPQRLRMLGARFDAALSTIASALAQREGLPIPHHASSRTLEEMSLNRLQEKAGSGFIVLSSVSGGGKSTIGKMLEERGYVRLPRVTTRLTRPDEQHGHDYEFINREEFDTALAHGEFAYHKDTYGEGRAIRRSAIEAARAPGARVYAEGDALAYRDIQERLPEYKDLHYLSVFLLPPSFDEMVSRLSSRIDFHVAAGGAEDTLRKDQDERIASGIAYLEKAVLHVTSGTYDAFIANDDLERVRGVIKTLTDAPS